MSRRPLEATRAAANAVYALVIDPMRNSVLSGSTGLPVATSATP